MFLRSGLLTINKNKESGEKKYFIWRKTPEITTTIVLLFWVIGTII
jgi:hypothetical protein